MIDSEHFTELLAAERLEPRGEWRADLRSAIVAMVQASAFRGKHAPAPKVADFMPCFEKPKKKTGEELKAKMADVKAALQARRELLQRKTKSNKKK